MKQKVIDKNGSVVQGLYRDTTGALVVDDKSAYNKSITVKQNIDSMLSRIDRLETMLAAVLNNINKE